MVLPSTGTLHVFSWTFCPDGRPKEANLYFRTAPGGAPWVGIYAPARPGRLCWIPRRGLPPTLRSLGPELPLGWEALGEPERSGEGWHTSVRR